MPSLCDNCARVAQDHPLGVCDGSTVSPEDYVTFEVRYADRSGENYFASHNPAHQWYYYPKMTKDEVYCQIFDLMFAAMHTVISCSSAHRADQKEHAFKSSPSLL